MINYNSMVVHVDGDGVMDATAREVFGALVGGIPVFVSFKYGECGDLDSIPSGDAPAVVGFISSFEIDDGVYYVVAAGTSTFSASNLDDYLTFST